MPNEQDRPEEKLEKLAPALQRGWKKLHPVKEKHLDKVREAVTQKWQSDLKQRLEEGASRENSKGHEQDEEHGH